MSLICQFSWFLQLLQICYTTYLKGAASYLQRYWIGKLEILTNDVSNDILKISSKFMVPKLILWSENKPIGFGQLKVSDHTQTIFCIFFALVEWRIVKAFRWCFIWHVKWNTLEVMTKRSASILLSSPLRVYDQISWSSLWTIYRGLLDWGKIFKT